MDNYSLLAGDGFTLCGLRAYSVSPITELYIEPTGNIVFLNVTASESLTTFRTGIITVSLVDYPEVDSVAFNFNYYIVSKCIDSKLINYNGIVFEELVYVIGNDLYTQGISSYVPTLQS